MVVVGASLGGLRAADALVRAGYDGEVTLIGEEPHYPYNRPPLSKEALVAEHDFEKIRLRSSAKADAYRVMLGTRVERVDLSRGELYLADGSSRGFDGLIAASGLRSRALGIPKPPGGILSLRSYDDLLSLRAQLGGVTKVVIIGAGFIGCELAASLTTLGLQVTVIAPEEVPMLRPLGHDLGAAIQHRHERHGVHFALERLPVAIEGGLRPSAVICDDGSRYEAQLVIEAVGSTTNVEWLQDNGLDLTDGVACNEKLQFAGHPNCFAVGDIARFPNLLFDGVARRVEHWGIAVDSGRHAGKALASVLRSNEPVQEFRPMPAFWSDQFDLRIQSFGMPGLVQDSASIRVIEGDLADEVAVGYYREEILVGVVLLGMAQSHNKYRKILADNLG